MKGYIKKHSTSHIIAGASRGLIYDSNQKIYFIVPLSLIAFIQNCQYKTEEEIKEMYANADLAIVQEYFEFLIEKEIVFFADSKEELDRFPDIDLTWEYPAIISNAIVEVNGQSSVIDFITFQQDVFIPYIQYSIHKSIKNLDELEEYIDLMLDTNVKGIQLLFKNEAAFTEAELEDLCNRKHRIETIIAYGSESEKIVSTMTFRIYFVQKKEINSLSCGLVNIEYFNLQFDHFKESQSHNTCLNRKISIDQEGNIKNCPAMLQSFGNIKSTTITEVTERQDFTKYWTITKDQISVCKDCEFRHICTDCRAFLDDPANPYSKPLKCGYNPYSNIWEDWSTSPLKTKAMVHYGLG